MMMIFSYVLPVLRKVKLLAILVVVFLISYFVCRRWRHAFSPWYLYTGIAVGITAFILLIYVWWKWRHEKKMAAGLEAGITESDEDKVDLKGEIKALRDNWNDSLARLRESAGGKSAAATLYRLPWYIIIGEPASGKSTLLRKSGLDFPVGDAAISGMHGTRNCDWWFANEAIFLDTAGRYIIETQEAEWVTFLGLLKKYRKQRPINGVLVAVAANSLLTKTHEELLTDAKRIRSRLDELIDELGINFPTYILITKCDLISGFVEFFGPLDGQYRDQMIGWTNPPDPEAKFDATEFDARFRETSEGLYRMRPWLESIGSKRGLMQAFLFPEEFSYLQQPLRTVLDNAFKPNVYQETPVCRGVYFSSGTQVGSPLALALEDMAKDLNIAGLDELGLGMGMQEEKEVRTYFIKDFVSEQVLKDRDMNWRTRAAEQRLKKRRMGWGLMGVAAAALLALFGTSSFLANRGRLTDFREHLPEAGRPLEVAVGCLNARDNAVTPGILDIGLNYSDELMPSFTRTFHELFTQGCLDPMVDSLKTSMARGLPETPEGAPDVERYVRTYGHYLYLRDGISGKWSEKFGKAKEQGHLDALFDLLRKDDAVGEAQPKDLRMAIYRFGQSAGLMGLAEYRRREIESEFAKHIGRFVTEVAAWVTAVERRAEGLSGNLRKAVDGLVSTAKRDTTHESPEAVVELAVEIKRAANPFRDSAAGGIKPLGKLAAGVQELRELSSLLRVVGQGLEEGDPATAKIKDLVRRLSVTGTDPEEARKDEARRGLVEFLTDVIELTPVQATYDKSPTGRRLESRQEEIANDLSDLGDRALERIRPSVEALGEEIERPDKDGKLVRQKGWWDTFVFLVKARNADYRMDEYLDRGLTPWLTGDRWKKERSSDRENETYTVTRLEELILPRLRTQTKFFENPLVATSITETAHDKATLGLRRYLDEMEAYWLGEFRRAVPRNPARTLTDAYEQFRSWNDQRSDLLRVAAEINSSVWDISRLKGPEEDMEDDPVLLGTDLDRARIFDTFVVCFTAEDRRVRQHMTIAEGARVFEALEKALEPVAGGFGGGDRSAARQLVGQILAGGGRSSPFFKGMEVVGHLKKTGSTSEPARLLAAWMDPLIRNTWTGLVELTVSDLNERWGRKREEWIRDLTADRSPATYNRIFGPGGQYQTFQRELLEPFFDFPGPEPKQSPGASLEVIGQFSSFLRIVDAVAGDVFDSSGSFRKERLQCTLALGGDANPVSLQIEYLSKDEEPKLSGEFRNSTLNQNFTFVWTPETCRGLRFIVGLPGNETREFKWEGEWAVARALVEAKRVGSTYVWSKKDPALGTYEVQLKILGQDRLVQVLRKTNGKNPVFEVVANIPEKIVLVKKK